MWFLICTLSDFNLLFVGWCQGRTDLNGSLGSIVEWDAAEERWKADSRCEKKTVEWVGKRNQRCSFFESNKVVWHAVYGYWILHLNIRLMLCCHWFVIATESLVMLQTCWRCMVYALLMVVLAHGKLRWFCFQTSLATHVFGSPSCLLHWTRRNSKGGHWMMVVARCCGAVIWR